MRKSRRWRKEFPYYKIQVFDRVVNSWKDERRVFDTVEAAREYIVQRIAPQPAHIIVVESNGRHLLDS